MKYFIDTEFIEGFHKPLFGKSRHFIDLISIGIVCEDGRTLYRISDSFSYKDADDWVRKNVISPMYVNTVSGDDRNRYNVTNFQKGYGKSNRQIAEDIYSFVCPYDKAVMYAGSNGIAYGQKQYLKYNRPSFYAYFADYDWVVLCSLFGRMIDLPDGFPMYCNDVKQELDTLACSLIPTHTNMFSKVDGEDIDKAVNKIKSHPYYPKNSNEHNALADAKWNMALHNFLKIY